MSYEKRIFLFAESQYILQWLISKDQETVFYHTVDFRKHSSFNEAEEPELELIESTTRFLKLSEVLRETVAGIRLSADSDCNEQRTAANGQRKVRMLAVLL